MSDEFHPDLINRTALWFLHGAEDANAGLTRFKASRMRIVAGTDVCRSREGQAALVTAAMTGVRAFAEVAIVIAVPEAELLGGPSRGRTLREVLADEGARVLNAVDPEDPVPTLILGPPPESGAARADWLVAGWTGWTGTVQPLRSIRDDDLGRCDGNVLASVTAGALGVAEVFLRMLAEPGSDAGLRTIKIDLWSPRGEAAAPPRRLMYAPAQWWFLGVGHLGQGFAHVLSWLDYRNPGEVEVVLQDIQKTVPANHSTGLITPFGSEGEHKARLVAGALDRCGFGTVVVERLLDGKSPVRQSDMHVALIGVDNLSTRLLIEGTGWQTAIDVGLGAGATDFDGITVVRFPGRPEAIIRSWRERQLKGSVLTDEVAEVPGLDACGMARLNGIAVGASFVGAIAGAFGIAESLRCLHGGVAHSILSSSLRDGETNGALVDAELPVSLDLR